MDENTKDKPKTDKDHTPICPWWDDKQCSCGVRPASGLSNEQKARKFIKDHFQVVVVR